MQQECKYNNLTRLELVTVLRIIKRITYANIMNFKICVTVLIFSSSQILILI